MFSQQQSLKTGKLVEQLSLCNSVSAACLRIALVNMAGVLKQSDQVLTSTLHFSAGFDDQEWYQQLFDYGMGPSVAPQQQQQQQGSDPDEELIPRLVRELVLPRALHALRCVWNPASRRQTRAAAAVVADLLVYVPADDPKMQVRMRARCCMHTGHLLCPPVRDKCGNLAF